LKITDIKASKFGSYQNKNNKTQKNTSQVVSNPNVNFTGFKLEGSFIDPTFSWAKSYLYKFSNKLTAIILEKPQTELTFLSTRVNTGALNEREAIRGISHLEEHSVFLASKGEEPGAFDKFCAKFGAEEDAYTSYNNTSFIVGTSSNNPHELQPLVGSYANMLINPEFSLNPLEKEKEIVIQEIKKYQNDPENLLNETSIKSLFGINTKSEDLILGTEENIRNITREDLLRHHKDFYAPNNTQIFAVTGMNHEKMAELIDKNFVTPDFMPSATSEFFTPTKLLTKTQIDFIESPLSNSDSIRIAFAGPKNSDTKDLVAADALLKILAGNSFSRLSRNLLKFDATPEAGIIPVSNHPLQSQKMTFAMDFRHSSLQKVLDGFRSTIDGLKTNPIKQEELDIAKKSLLLSFYENAKSVEDFTFQYDIMTPAMDPTPYKNYLNIVKGLNLDDVATAAQKYLHMDKASVIILHPPKKDVKGISFMGKSAPNSAIKKYLLPNNVRLVLNDNARALQTSVIASLEASSLSHAKPGVTDVLSKILENSTAKHSEEKLSYFKALNGLDNFKIDSKNSGVSAQSVSLNEDLLSAVKMIKEMLFEPKINKINFNKAKNEVILAVESQLSQSEDRAFEALYGKHPESITPRLLKEKIDEVNIEDVQEYYAKLIKNARFNVSVSGPLDQIIGLKNDVVKEFAQIDKVFNKNKVNEPKINLPSTDKVVIQHEAGREGTEISQIFHLDLKTPKDFASVTILNTILGSCGSTSRLFSDLREKQKLAYSIHSYFTPSESFAQEYLNIATGIKGKDGEITDNIAKSVEGFAKHIKLLIDEAPSEEEVLKAKMTILTKKNMNADDIELSNESLFFALKNGLGTDFSKKVLAEIKNITPQDVQETVKKYFSQPSVISVLTTKEAAEKSQKFLEKFGEIKVYTQD